MTDDTLKLLFSDTKFVVEATHTEYFFLWKQYSNQAIHKTEANVYVWEQINEGISETVGHLGWFGTHPVCVSMFWARINGTLIMFYEAISRMVDHEMVRKFIASKCSPRWDKGHREAHCDAMNFHHVLEYVKHEDRR